MPSNQFQGRLTRHFSFNFIFSCSLDDAAFSLLFEATGNQTCFPKDQFDISVVAYARTGTGLKSTINHLFISQVPDKFLLMTTSRGLFQVLSRWLASSAPATLGYSLRSLSGIILADPGWDFSRFLVDSGWGTSRFLADPGVSQAQTTFS